jgi:hypothetical protein
MITAIQNGETHVNRAFIIEIKTTSGGRGRTSRKVYDVCEIEKLSYY